LTAALLLCLARSASAQQPQPTTQPADGAVALEQLEALVIEVVGDVKKAPVGTSPLDADLWVPVELAERLPAGVMIRTGLRSQLILQFGTDTVISIQRATLAAITDFYKSEGGKTVRVGLGYGAVRGGSTESTLRSDVIVDSAVATLAKRGTQGFQMAVEPYTGRFTISLAREGLVDAIQKSTGQSRTLRPGQYATESNIAKMWVNTARFDRSVKFVAAESMSEADLETNTTSSGGMATISPGTSTETLALTGRQERPDSVLPPILSTEERQRQQQIIQNLFPADGTDMMIFDRSNLRRPEGNFGIANRFRVMVPDNRTNRSMGRSKFAAPRPTRRR
jgi:hypothetical protein